MESSTGKLCYRVTLDDPSCACSDYAINIQKDKGYVCKHILAASNAGETIHLYEKDRIRLDERFITTIKGNDFVKYTGLLDLAHQKGLTKLIVEALQYPTKENGQEAICRATAETRNGVVFADYGDASPRNVNADVSAHILRLAATEPKARALRDMTNIGMTCLEGLGNLDAITSDDKAGKPDNVRKLPRKEPRTEKKEAASDKDKNVSQASPEKPKSIPQATQHPGAPEAGQKGSTSPSPKRRYRRRRRTP